MKKVLSIAAILVLVVSVGMVSAAGTIRPVKFAMKSPIRMA